MALGIKSVCVSSFCDFGAKLYKISGMLRTKVDEIGCYYRKKMIFSKFSKNHFQKSRVSPENRFRISRYFIQPKTKKTRGTDRNPAQPRPKPLLLIDWQWKSTLFQPKNKEEMTLFQDAATFTIAKKRQRGPKQATSDLFKTKTTNPSSRHPKYTTANKTIPKEKHFQIFRPDNAYGIRT